MNGIVPLSPEETKRTVGISTTVPVEILFAAGLRPLDLNNVFITSGEAPSLVEVAEQRGFPRNSCAWTKGIYATTRRLGLKRVVAVVQGDCANTHAMAEMLRADGVEVIPFAFPYDPNDAEMMVLALERFAAAFGTTPTRAEEWKLRLDAVRALAHRMDELCWKQNLVTGEEQHLWTISCSDFFGDPEEFSAEARDLIKQAEVREPLADSLRIALIGIPPICEGFFPFLEERGARVVFNEIPRQFAMPVKGRSLQEQYTRYTYPYDIFYRLADIKRQVALRRVDGVIHYVQSFCFRQVQDTIIRREICHPILTLECDRPGPLDLRTETRVEAFLEMLREGGPRSGVGGKAEGGRLKEEG